MLHVCYLGKAITPVLLASDEAFKAWDNLAGFLNREPELQNWLLQTLLVPSLHQQSPATILSVKNGF